MQNAPKARKPTACSNCKQVGHTKLKCPQRSVAQINQQPKRRKTSQVPAINPRNNNIILEAAINDFDGEVDRDENNNYDEEHEGDDEQIDPVDLNEDNAEEINGAAPNFNYEWTEYPINSPPIVVTRRETKILLDSKVPFFRQGNLGPNRAEIRSLAATTELDFFQIFWTQDIMETTCINSNWYGEKFIRGWMELEVPEFKAFLSIVMELGKIKFPSRESAFNNSIHGSGFIKIVGMNLARFNSIVKAWRYEDFSELTVEEIAAKKRDDPFWPIKKLSEELASTFQYMYQCSQAMDIDEQTVPFKGRHKCRCYNPKKYTNGTSKYMH